MISGDGGQSTSSEIATWVKKHGTAVAASAYGSASSSGGSGLYRLDPSDVG
jgi:hypothetical protein